MAERKPLKKVKAKATAPKRDSGSPREARDIGIDVNRPEKTCNDPTCPFHGTLPVRGQRIEGIVASNKMDKTIVVKREYMHFVPKYERIEKRSGRYLAHKPDCIDLNAGDSVTIMECRPLSKAVSYVVVERR